MVFDIKREDAGAITIALVALNKCMFSLIEGSEITSIAVAKERLAELRSRLVKYQAEVDEETKQKMADKVKSAVLAPSNPVTAPSEGPSSDGN